MRSAVGIGDGIGKAEDLIIVAVIVLDDTVHKDLVLLCAQYDRIRIDHVLSFAQLAHKFLDTVLVEELLLFILFPFILQDDLDAGIQESQLAQTAGQYLEFELGGNGKDFRIRQERDIRTGRLGTANHLQFLGRLAAGKSHVIHFAVAIYLHLEPLGKRVHTLGTYTMQTAGILISPLAKLAAGMEIRQNQLHRRDLELGMYIYRDTASIIFDRNRAVHMDRDYDLLAEAGQMLVDRVIQHLKHTMMQTVFIRVANVHSWALANSLQTLQFINLGSVIFLASGRVEIGSGRLTVVR